MGGLVDDWGIDVQNDLGLFKQALAGLDANGDVIAKPAGDDPKDFKTLSVTHHASIDGTVTDVSDAHVVIEQK